MFWGGVSHHHQTELVVIAGNLNAGLGVKAVEKPFGPKLGAPVPLAMW